VVENLHHQGAQHGACPKGWEPKQVAPTLLRTPPCPISKLKCDVEDLTRFDVVAYMGNVN